MLYKRVLSGVVGLILLAAAVLAGSLPFFAATAAVAGAGAVEYHRLLPVEDDNQLLLPLLVISFMASQYLLPAERALSAAGLIIFFSFFYMYFDQLKNYSYDDIMTRLAGKLFGIIYMGGGMYIIALLRDFSRPPLEGTRALWLVLLAAWSADTGAYFVGRAWGRTPLAPEISPNKTVAGGLGGIISSVLAVSIFMLILGEFSLIWTFVAALISIAALLGDLFISCLKRDAGVKDAGYIIPGHGGILDRFDSLLLSAPLAYILLILLL